MTLKNHFAKWGWKAAAGIVGVLALLAVVLIVVLPKQKSDAVIATALDMQKKLDDNAKEHEVRIAVARAKHEEGSEQLQERLARIDAEPDSRKRRQALIDMHKEMSG